jgi:hypothetical protein
MSELKGMKTVPNPPIERFWCTVGACISGYLAYLVIWPIVTEPPSQSPAITQIIAAPILIMLMLFGLGCIGFCLWFIYSAMKSTKEVIDYTDQIKFLVIEIAALYTARDEQVAMEAYEEAQMLSDRILQREQTLAELRRMP